MATIMAYSGMSKQIAQAVERIVTETTNNEVAKALEGVREKISVIVAERVGHLVCHVLQNHNDFGRDPTITIVIKDAGEK